MAKAKSSQSSNVAAQAAPSASSAPENTEREPALAVESSTRPSASQIASEIKSPEDIALLREALTLAEANQAAKGDLGDEDAKIVRVYHGNKSKGSFIHGPYRLDPDGHADVPESVAKLWLDHKDAAGAPLCVLSEAAPVQPSAEANRLKAELEAKAKENDGLSGQIKALEAQLAAAKASGLTEPPAQTS